MQVVNQTLEQVAESNLTTVAELAQNWRSRLEVDCPEQTAATKESIIRWLLGDLERFDRLNLNELEISKQAMEYRYRLLRQRYLGLPPARAYRNLMTRLGSLVLLRNKIRTWVSLSRDRSLAVVDVLQEVIQELLQSNRYMQQQLTWIAQCTSNPQLRNAMLFASTEEYCLRPVRNQPLIVYRFINYLRRTQRGGLTQVPNSDLIKLVSAEFITKDSEKPISLLDRQVIAQYEDTQALENQQALRNEVKQEFEMYLACQLGTEAVQWLNLYLQGQSQEAIAQSLNLEIKQVYRLREKISYHAVRVFALKNKPELVSKWLEISLQEHSFGLTPQQWQQYWEQLTSPQRQIIELFKLGKNIEAIAQVLHLKTHQVMGEWTQMYLLAQTLRSQR